MDVFLHKLHEHFATPFQNSVLIFAVILAIIFLAPLIFRRLKIPGIIVLIISGAIIGPQGLNLIERNEAIILFSTIGLLYIMFLAGLELDLHEFGKNRHKSILFGFFTFSIPLVLGFPVCFFLLEYSFTTSLLTASMFATHTLIAYSIVSRMDVARNEAVAITVGGTIITDTAVLIILALITGSQQGGLSFALWSRLGISFLLFFLFMFLLVPRICRWFFKKLENERYTHYIFVLAVVFFSAFLAELASLEPIIGAFAAGLVLNKLVPKTSPLMNRIEFAGNALFIPFFLISVGMIIDLGAISKGPWALVVAAALTAVALLGKWLAAFFTARVLGYSSVQRRLIYGLSSSHAVATLAVITVGFNMGIIDEHILNGTILLILVTCLVASFVTENAARALAVQEKESEPELNALFDEKILVPISNPGTMNRLIDLALAFSGSKKDIPVYGLSVVQDDQEAASKLAQSRRILDKLMNHAAEMDRKLEVVTTIDQNVANGIRRVVREIGASEILIGTSPQVRLAAAIFGKLMDHLMNSTNQMIFVYNPIQPMDIHQNLHIICPAHSDKEYGFNDWLTRVVALAKHLHAKCTFYCEDNISPVVQKAFAHAKTSYKPSFTKYVDQEHLTMILSGMQASDLIVLIHPRKETVSYDVGYSRIFYIIDKKFTDMSYLVISPKGKDEVLYTTAF